MINFDSLPTNAPSGNNIIPAGHYIGTIVKAEMKQPKDDTKPPYLSLTWDVKDDNGKGYGKLFDTISESESEYVRYKLRCFIAALDINLGKTFELRDLAKVSVGKVCEITVMVDEKSEPNKSQINLFATDMYKRIPKKVQEDFETGEDLPFTMGAAEEPNADSDY